MALERQGSLPARAARAWGKAVKLATNVDIFAMWEMPRLSFNERIRSTHDLITKELAKRVLSGQYAVGETLPSEGDLLDEFRASRTALREALKTLAAKGLIVAKTRIGTRVLPSSFWNFYDPQVLSWRLENGVDANFLQMLFEVRQALEPAAAALAATRVTAENLERLQGFLAAMDRQHESPVSYAEPDLGFHQEVLMASHNPFLQSFSSIIEASILCAFQISAPVDSPERQAKSIRRHAEVLDALVAGDAAEASRAMSEVIVEGLENAHFTLARKPV
jgi:DNA-binding FadR family transcriptional regulator